MRDLQELSIYNTVKVKLNEKGIDYLQELYGDLYNVRMDDKGLKEYQLWKFFNTFNRCPKGFDYIIYKLEDEYLRLYNDTEIDVKFTDLGMSLYYDIALDGIVRNPSNVTSISISMLIETLGKYITQGHNLPIEQYFMLDTNNIPKVRSLKK